MEKTETELTATKRPVWNAGRTVGAKRALKPKQIWEIRFYLTQRRRLRDWALFDLAIDSKRSCRERSWAAHAGVHCAEFINGMRRFSIDERLAVGRPPPRSYTLAR